MMLWFFKILYNCYWKNKRTSKANFEIYYLFFKAAFPIKLIFRGVLPTIFTRNVISLVVRNSISDHKIYIHTITELLSTCNTLYYEDCTKELIILVENTQQTHDNFINNLDNTHIPRQRSTWVMWKWTFKWQDQQSNRNSK